MKKIVRMGLLGILLGGLLAGGFWAYQSYVAPQTVVMADEGTTMTVTAQRGDLSASISIVGELAAVDQEDLSFDRMDGTDGLVTLEVEAGNSVEAGQVLATIDPEPYQEALDGFSAERAAEMDGLLSGKTILDIQELMDSGQIHAVDLVTYYLARIQKYDVDMLNSVMELNPEALEIAAQLGILTLPIKDILDLQVGDIIDLDYNPDAPLNIMVEKKPKYHGHAALHNGKKSIQITSKYLEGDHNGN